MRKGACFFGIVVAMMLSARSLEAGNAWEEGVFYRGILRAAFGSLDRVISLMGPSQLLSFRADDGGDGGDGGGTGTGDGGSGTGDGSTGGDSSGGDSTGDDSTSGDSTSNAGADAAAAAAAANDAPTTAANDAAAAAAAQTTDPSTEIAPTTNQTTDPTTDNNAVTVVQAPTTDPANTVVANPTDQTISNNAVTPELAAIEAIPTTDPRGGEVVAPTVSNGLTPGTTVEAGPGGVTSGPSGPGAGAPPAPVDVEINAVIVSAAQSPWDAVKRTPGVRNVIVTGGVIALGKTPVAGENPGGGPEPTWLRVIPDPRLLNGSVVPPVVPNVIDIRVMNCPIKVESSAE
jgi:hypothetical protein